jgi:3-methyladenine DNA glycosylase AlkD
MFKEVLNNIQSRITSVGNPEKARWLENYIKHGIKSKGVGIPAIREIVKKTTRDYKLTDWDILGQIELLNGLMTSEFTEDKLSAIIYIQLYWSRINKHEKIALISDWFDKGLIADWNVCDWLCVRILTPLIDNFTKETLEELKKWNKNQNLWKARASLVAFAPCKSHAKHKKVIEAFSIELIKREERFCKTAVGWVLREFSKTDAGFVAGFLNKYQSWTTKEVIRNAGKYMNK